MEKEGVVFITNIEIGIDVPASILADDFDVLLLTGGSTIPRNLEIPGRELKGVHFAMEFLTQQNNVNAGLVVPEKERIVTTEKKVAILGGGDTGSDCLGTSHRQGASQVHQLELLPEPPEERGENDRWPNWPMIIRTSSSHEEGGLRDYNILTKKFTGENGVLKKLHGVRLEWGEPDENGRPQMIEVGGSEFEIETDYVFLALGFLHPQHEGTVEELGLDLDPRGNVKTDSNKMTNTPGVFAAGDMSRGQSLVVWALAEGREAARGIDEYLMGETSLPKSAGSYIG